MFSVFCIMKGPSNVREDEMSFLKYFLCEMSNMMLDVGPIIYVSLSIIFWKFRPLLYLRKKQGSKIVVGMSRENG